MKITYITGHYSMDIDGKEFVSLTEDQQKELLHKIVDKSDSASLQRYLEIFMECGPTEYEDMGECEECGDYIEKYIYEA